MTNFSATSWQVESSRGSRPFQPGDIVMDSWEVVRLLGEGGYGSVYEIRKNIYGVDSVSALKVIPIPKERNYIDAMRSMGSTKAQIDEEIRNQVNRAVAEVQAMKRLIDHPAVVRCEDFSVVQYEDDESWDIFIRMELLSSLPDWMKDHPITADKVREIGVTLADLLQYCAEEKILHRDIKPANIFMNRRGSCKLGDFGLARTLSVGTSTHSHGVGTDAFMAPEVATNQHYDTRADMYSLGLVLYWLLNNRRLPFMVDSVPFSQAIALRVTGQPLPPINGVDPSLMSAILRACAFRAEDRYKSAAELKQALLNHDNSIAVKPVTTIPPTPAEQPVLPKFLYSIGKIFTSGSSAPATVSGPAASSDPWIGAEIRYAPGNVVEGIVTEITGIGASVQLEPGVVGTVHISECSYQRIARVEEVVHLGDPVRVKILRVNAGQKRIILSIRQASLLPNVSSQSLVPPEQQSPLVSITEMLTSHRSWRDKRYAVGNIVEGVVLEILAKGVTVQVEIGMEGIVPNAECPDDRALEVGDVVNVKILYIDPVLKRLTLSIRQAQESNPPPEKTIEEEQKSSDSTWCGASTNELPKGFLLSPPYVKPPKGSDPKNFRLRDSYFSTYISYHDYGSFAPMDQFDFRYTIRVVPICLLITKEAIGASPQSQTTALMFNSIRDIWFYTERKNLTKTATVILSFKEPNTCPIRISHTLVSDLRKLMDRVAEYAQIRIFDGPGIWPVLNTNGKFNIEFSGYQKEKYLETIKALRTWDPQMNLETAHNLLKRVPVTINRSVSFQEARQTVELLNQGGAVCRVTDVG